MRRFDNRCSSISDNVLDSGPNVLRCAEHVARHIFGGSVGHDCNAKKNFSLEKREATKHDVRTRKRNARYTRYAVGKRAKESNHIVGHIIDIGGRLQSSRFMTSNIVHTSQHFLPSAGSSSSNHVRLHAKQRSIQDERISRYGTV